MPSSPEQFPTKLRQAFHFLETELGFKVLHEEQLPGASTVEYARGERRVRLTYDFNKDAFYFVVIRGAKTRYPNDRDFENVLPLYWLFMQFEPSVDPQLLQPFRRDYDEALALNAALLRKHGGAVLSGATWIAPPPRPED